MWCTGAEVPLSCVPWVSIAEVFALTIGKKIGVVNTRMDEWVWSPIPALDAEDDDLMGEMISGFVQGLMSVEADVIYGAGWGVLRSGANLDDRLTLEKRRV